MTDLSPSELDEYGDSTGACDHLVTVRMVAEIRRWRAAAAADEVRVRSDVKAYAVKVIGGYLGAGLGSATTQACADAIASRAAKQLASSAVRLSEDDARAIQRFFDHVQLWAQWHEHIDGRDALARLLATVRP